MSRLSGVKIMVGPCDHEIVMFIDLKPEPPSSREYTDLRPLRFRESERAVWLNHRRGIML